MSGAVQTVVICIPQQGATATGVCGANYVESTTQAYVLDPAQAAIYESSVEPVDAATASSVFVAAFSAVVTCFFVSRVVGSVLNMIRR